MQQCRRRDEDTDLLRARQPDAPIPGRMETIDRCERARDALHVTLLRVQHDLVSLNAAGTKRRLAFSVAADIKVDTRRHQFQDFAGAHAKYMRRATL